MKIAMTGHVYPLPPSGYAGVERVASWWIEALRARGHKVVLVANADSKLPVDRLIPKRSGVADAFVDGILQAGGCDIVHDNNDCHHPDPRRWNRPYVYTVHAMVWNGNPNPVFISQNQARHFRYREQSGRDPVVNHNGLPVAQYPYREDKEDYLLWCGAIREPKNPEMAIALAVETGWRLKIIGPIQDARFAYLWTYKPGAGPIEYLGELGAERLDVFQRAAIFLYTCSDSWVEGFNLTTIEALLSGTPVFGWRTERNRIIEEQIDEGSSGFIFDDYATFRQALADEWHRQIHPRDCRAKGETHSVTRTVDRYLEIYQRAIAGEKW